MSEINRNRCYVNFNDRENPVPGSAADIAKRARDAREKLILEQSRADIDKACENFPAFARILEIVKNKG